MSLLQHNTEQLIRMVQSVFLSVYTCSYGHNFQLTLKLFTLCIRIMTEFVASKFDDPCIIFTLSAFQ